MMTYEERASAVDDWMRAPSSLFQRRDPPRRLVRTDKVAQEELCRAEMTEIARAVIRNAPTNLDRDGFDALLGDAAQAFVESTRTASWPTPGEMVEAIRSASAPAPQSNSTEPNGPVQLTDRERTQVAAIQARRWGDVSGFYITGVGARRLLEHGLISADDVRAFEDHRRAQELPKVASRGVG